MQLFIFFTEITFKGKNEYYKTIKYEIKKKNITFIEMWKWIYLSTNDKEEQYWPAVGCRPCVFTQVKSQQH